MGPNDMLKSFKELMVWQKSYKLCLMLKALIKTLENKHLAPWTLGPFSPTNLEMN